MVASQVREKEQQQEQGENGFATVLSPLLKKTPLH